MHNNVTEGMKHFVRIEVWGESWSEGSVNQWFEVKVIASATRVSDSAVNRFEFEHSDNSGNSVESVIEERKDITADDVRAMIARSKDAHAHFIDDSFTFINSDTGAETEFMV